MFKFCLKFNEQVHIVGTMTKKKKKKKGKKGKVLMNLQFSSNNNIDEQPTKKKDFKMKFFLNFRKNFKIKKKKKIWKKN